MKKGTRYNSIWDTSTWLIFALVVAVSIWPVFIDKSILPIIIAISLLICVIVVFLGIYYRIDGDKLIIYQFFIPTAYPINKIAEIKPTTSILSSPATSLTKRLAIKFSDKSILKSSIPLIISPVRQKEFIDQLLSINPGIIY